MGSFVGYALQGSFFYLLGLFWVTQVLRRHFRYCGASQLFRVTSTFPLPYSPGARRTRSFPVKAIVNIALSCILILGELSLGQVHEEEHSLFNAQHIVMYFFFALYGVVDLLMLKDLVPVGSEDVSLMLALLGEAALFKFHLFGRETLDVLLHALLVYVIILNVVVVGLEAAFRHVPLLPVLRGLLFMLQGSWFWAAGTILYSPFPGSQPWDPNPNHHDSLC